MNCRQRKRQRKRKERFVTEVALAAMLHAEQEGWFEGFGPTDKFDRLIRRLTALIAACIKNFPRYEREWKHKHRRSRSLVPNRFQLPVPSPQ